MKITTVLSLPLAEARQAFPMLESFISWRTSSYPLDCAALLDVPANDLPLELGADADTLLLVLPDELEPVLDELAASPLTTYNRHSDDLLSSATYLALQIDDTTVEFDFRRLRYFPNSMQQDRFYVCLVSAQRFLLVKHDLGAEGMDELLGGLQGACGSSGINYKPHTYWSEEELDAAARGETPVGDPMEPEPAWWLTCRVLSEDAEGVGAD
jgi:hypothetical protein